MPPAGDLTSPSTAKAAAAFVDKWSRTELTERAASHEHFIDLCHLIGVPTPAAADATGEDYCFEKNVVPIAAASKGSKGDTGFVDVWKRGCFAWEYKRKDRHKDLNDAFRQVYQFRDALDNPPLSVTCDISTTVIHTHFTGYPRDTQTIRLEEIPSKLHVLRRVFTDPDSFRNTLVRTDDVTKQVADEFQKLADNLIDRVTAPQASFTGEAAGKFTLLAPGFFHHQDVAHFLMKLIFCLFAEDIDLLPGDIFTRLVNRALTDPDSFPRRATELFDLMRTGGEFGNDRIPWFNGGLFDDKPALPLKHGNLLILQKIAQKDWGGIEPSIFGTLFERLLDPAKRSQIGAHYTSKDDILLVVNPVVMAPLRREWDAIKADLAPHIDAYAKETTPKKRAALREPVIKRIEAYRDRLGEVSILDPACGSGNFLYVALRSLLDLDDEVVRYASSLGLYLDPRPKVRPIQLHGIEINPYAAELAQVVIWIGYLQWLKDHGIEPRSDPILDKLQSIENRDAILDLSDRDHPAPAKWPKADFIIGNPPFLGSSLLRQQLGHEYTEALFRTYDIPKTSDLCAYWFVVGGNQIRDDRTRRAGLLATQGIRGGGSNEVLRRLAADGAIFEAWSDRDWVLEGAAVHVSIVCFDAGIEKERKINGRTIDSINPDLSTGADLTRAKRLQENDAISFRGNEKGGSFDIDWKQAREMLAIPNPTGKPNSAVVRPYANGMDVMRRTRSMWLIDFGIDTPLPDASLYEAPFKYVETHVKPERMGNRRDYVREKWWLLRGSWPGLKRALTGLNRYCGCPHVAKHFAVVWFQPPLVPDHQVIVFGRPDDFFFGVVHSAVHETWARAAGTQLREEESGFRYTPSSSFETFPFPWPPGKEKVKHPAYARVAAAAKALDEQRERWLNPPEWLDPLAAQVDATDDFADVPPDARPLVRRSAILAAAAQDPRLKKRTLTNLYNERPTWLKLAHLELDRAVLEAYRGCDPQGEWNPEWAEVWQDTGPGQPLPADHPQTTKRAEVDRFVLENLLRLNGERVTNNK